MTYLTTLDGFSLSSFLGKARAAIDRYGQPILGAVQTIQQGGGSLQSIAHGALSLLPPPASAAPVGGVPIAFTGGAAQAQGGTSMTPLVIGGGLLLLLLLGRRR